MSTFEVYCNRVKEFTQVPHSSLSCFTVEAFLDKVSLNEVFSVIGAGAELNNETIREQSISALKRIIKFPKGRKSVLELENIKVVVREGLRHSDDLVRKSTAKMLTSLITLNKSKSGDQLEAIISVVTNSYVLSSLMHLLAGDSTELAEEAASVIVELGKTGNSGVDIAFSVASVEHFRDLVESSTTNHVRVLSLIAKIATSSNYAFDAALRSGLLMRIFSLLKQKKDVLLQCSSFEIITKLSSCKQGFKFLLDNDVVEIISTFTADKVSSIVTCSALKVLNSFVNPTFDYNFYNWFGCEELKSFLQQCLSSTEEDVQIEAISAICSLNKHYQAFDELSSLIAQVPKFFMGNQYSSKIKMLAMKSFASTLFIYSKSNQASKLVAFTSQGEKGEAMKDLLDALKICIKDSCIDFRIGAYALLRSIANVNSGAEALYNSPAFMETLLDLSLEKNKRTKEMQWEVVRELVKNPVLAKQPYEKIRERLLEHLRKGSTYLPIEPSFLSG